MPKRRCTDGRLSSGQARQASAGHVKSAKSQCARSPKAGELGGIDDCADGASRLVHQERRSGKSWEGAVGCRDCDHLDRGICGLRGRLTALREGCREKFGWQLTSAVASLDGM